MKCLTTKQNFTIKELEDDLSGDYEVMYESGWTPCCRVVEDYFQICTSCNANPLRHLGMTS